MRKLQSRHLFCFLIGLVSTGAGPYAGYRDLIQCEKRIRLAIYDLSPTQVSANSVPTMECCSVFTGKDVNSRHSIFVFKDSSAYVYAFNPQPVAGSGREVRTYRLFSAQAAEQVIVESETMGENDIQNSVRFENTKDPLTGVDRRTPASLLAFNMASQRLNAAQASRLLEAHLASVVEDAKLWAEASKTFTPLRLDAGDHAVKMYKSLKNSEKEFIDSLKDAMASSECKAAFERKSLQPSRETLSALWKKPGAGSRP